MLYSVDRTQRRADREKPVRNAFKITFTGASQLMVDDYQPRRPEPTFLLWSSNQSPASGGSLLEERVTELRPSAQLIGTAHGGAGGRLSAWPAAGVCSTCFLAASSSSMPAVGSRSARPKPGGPGLLGETVAALWREVIARWLRSARGMTTTISCDGRVAQTPPLAERRTGQI